MLDDLAICTKYHYKELAGMKEERDLSLEEIKVYMMEKEKLDKILVEKEVVIKTIILFVVGLVRSGISLETEKR